MNTAQKLAQQSIALTKAGDKQGWLNLFADDALVQDPVGESFLDASGEGHQGIEAIGKFWDNCRTHGTTDGTIHESFAAGDSCANVLTLVTTMPDGSQSVVKNVTVYNANSNGKLSSLQAYWNMDQLK